jgi:hypothetical protein
MGGWAATVTPSVQAGGGGGDGGDRMAEEVVAGLRGAFLTVKWVRGSRVLVSPRERDQQLSRHFHLHFHPKHPSFYSSRPTTTICKAHSQEHKTVKFK